MTQKKLEASSNPQQLVTISGPFAGIDSARTCGNRWLSIATLGATNVICQIITGDKYRDITAHSDFIRNPGSLDGSVKRYVKINTDEKNSCRQQENNRCIESDFIFGLNEQHFQVVDDEDKTKNITIKAGHVEIVGNSRTAPTKLIAALQAEGIIRTSEPDKLAAFEFMLTQVYQTKKNGE